MPRLFVGVPAPDTLDLGGVRGALSDDDNVKLVEPELYHVTLAFLGDTPESLTQDALEAIEAGVGDVAPHEGRVRGLGAFPNPGRASVIWAGVADTRLDALAEGVRDELDERSIDYDDRHDFHPHLTVPRLRDREDRQGLLKPHEATDFGAFPVERVHLYESTLTPEGPEYEARGTVELG